MHRHVRLRLKWCQRSGYLETQISQCRNGWQDNVPISSIRSKPRRVGRRGNGCVVGRRAERVVRECRARRRRRVGRVRSRALRLAVGVAVVILLVLVGVAPRHAVAGQAGKMAAAPRRLHVRIVLVALILLVVRVGRSQRFPLDLVGGPRDHGIVKVVGRPGVALVETSAVCRVRVRRRHVG